MEHFSRSCCEIGVPLDLRRISQWISVVALRKKATCLVWWGMGDCIRSNTGKLGVILSWFGLHRTISHSIGDISVILDMWGCSWGLSRVPSSISKLLTCLIGNMELLYMQCRGIGPYLSLRGKTNAFPRVAAGTCGIFWSYGGDGHSILVFLQRSQHSCLVTMGTWVI